MVPERSRLIRQTTLALLVLASTATELAAVESRPLVASLGLATLWAGLAAVLSGVIPLPKGGNGIPPRYVLLLLLGLIAAPFLVEPFTREWTGEGYPLELQMVFALRNLGLGLAACALWPLCLRLACVVSLFLMLFAVTMTDHPAVLALLGLYSATGSIWLMLVYWTGLRRYWAASEAASLEVQPDRHSLPWLACLVVIGVVASMLGVVAVGPQRTAQALGEWLPTSGGTGGYDAFARSGINDGDDEVKGDNARSTGMTQSDLFLDSPLPTLYDMFNDTYGEPFKLKEQEKAIALDAQTRAQEDNKPPADNLRPNREFPTIRRSPRQPRDPADRAARALFEVQGRTPLHVRVTAFDLFDGVSWHEAPLNLNTCVLQKELASCWMQVQERTPAPVFAATEAHQFKITSSLGSLVPTPPHLNRFRIGRVDQASFFAWGQDRILRLAQRQTPSGIVVETACRTVDPQKLLTVEFPSGSNGSRLEYTTLSPNLHPDVRALAHRWADPQPHGWGQITAVLQRLRAEYVLDPQARVPNDSRDPLAHFLLRVHRGPDYQFAAAATVLLRVLGYPTRLVSGFYVAPDHYDPHTRHTPVVPEDVHFWPEVLLPSGDWLVLEPTPGYEVLGPSLPWSEHVWAALVAVAFWFWQHLALVSLSLVTLAGSWWRRHELLDTLAITWWRWLPGQSWQRCVRRVLWLLERRGRWAGRPRPLAQTFTSWLHAALPPTTACPRELAQLLQMADWAAYAPDLQPPWIEAEVQNVCRRVLDDWTLPRWRGLVSASVLRGEE
ncbi:MAG: transglutaminase-like domain-containing protein [Gemmataceae bacterium]|nr:transglutaminase-like domain-containing protein [Gemmataceae bacterium]